MTSAFRAFGLAVVRFRYAIVAAWIVFGAVCFLFFPSISSVAKDQNSGFLPKNSPSVKAQRLVSRFQNIDYGQITLVAGRASGRLTPADQRAVSALESRIRAMPRVVSVQDFGSAPDGKARQALVQARVPLNGTGAADTLVSTIRHDMTRTATRFARSAMASQPES